MEKNPEDASSEEDAKEAAERIEKMLEEGKRMIEEARHEAKEIKRQAREERRTARRERHKRRFHHRERKKEKVLNLRIGKDLENKIKAEAERINIPVSNLVRSILEDTFDLVEGIGTNVGNLVGDVVENAENIAENFRSVVKEYVSTDEQDAEAPAGGDKPSLDSLVDDVPAWQEVTAGKSALCAVCDETIGRGDKVHTGISDSTRERLFLCGKCIASVGETE